MRHNRHSAESTRFLRFRFCTSRTAVTKDVMQTALAAGNSASTIFSHCRALAAEAEGKTWFAIMPPHLAANVVCLPRLTESLIAAMHTPNALLPAEGDALRQVGAMKQAETRQARTGKRSRHCTISANPSLVQVVAREASCSLQRCTSTVTCTSSSCLRNNSR